MDIGISDAFASMKTHTVNNNKNSVRIISNNVQQNDTFIKSDIDIKWGFLKDKLVGEIDKMPFELEHGVHLFKTDSIKGSINNNIADLKYKNRPFFSDNLSGKIGDKDLDLKISHRFLGLKIEGTYNNQKINYKVKETLSGYRLMGDNVDLKVKGKNIFSNDYRVSGKYNDDKELLPLLLAILNKDRQTV